MNARTVLTYVHFPYVQQNLMVVGISPLFWSESGSELGSEEIYCMHEQSDGVKQWKGRISARATASADCGVEANISFWNKQSAFLEMSFFIVKVNSGWWSRRGRTWGKRWEGLVSDTHWVLFSLCLKVENNAQKKNFDVSVKFPNVSITYFKHICNLSIAPWNMRLLKRF